MPALSELGKHYSRRKLLVLGGTFLLGCSPAPHPVTPSPQPTILPQPTPETRTDPTPTQKVVEQPTAASQPTHPPRTTPSPSPQLSATSSEVPKAEKPLEQFPTPIARAGAKPAQAVPWQTTPHTPTPDKVPFLTSTPYVPPSPTPEAEVSLTQILEAKPGSKIAILWEREVGTRNFSPSYLVDDKFCYALDKTARRVVARDLQTGKAIWETAIVLQQLRDIRLDSRDPEILLVETLNDLTAYERPGGRYVWSLDTRPLKPPGMNMQLEFHHKIFSAYRHTASDSSFIAFAKMSGREVWRAFGRISHTTEKVAVVRPKGDGLEAWYTADLFKGTTASRVFADLPNDWQLHGYLAEENLFFTDISNPAKNDEYISSGIDLHQGKTLWKTTPQELPGYHYHINYGLILFEKNRPHYLYTFFGKDVYTRLAAIDKLKGKVIHTHDFRERIEPNWVIGEAQGTLVFSNNKTKDLVGINPEHSRNWTIKNFGSSKLVGSGHNDVLVVKRSRAPQKGVELSGLDKLTGNIVWHEEISSYVDYQDIVAFGKYIACPLLTDKKVYFFDAKSGERVGVLALPGEASDVKPLSPNSCLVYSSTTGAGGVVIAVKLI